MPDPPKEYRWKPGQSGNPSGRAKGTSLTKRLMRELEKDDGKLAEALVKAAITHALKGKHGPMKEIWDRIDGTVVQRVQQEDVVRRVLDAAEDALDPDDYAKLLSAIAADGAEPASRE